MQRILAIHDLSGWGHTSLLACIPIFYQQGIQVAVLPSCLLSTNTDYPGYQLQEQSELMRRSLTHWKSLGVHFDAIYSGFLAGAEQAELVQEALHFAVPGAPVLIDPVMADAGSLYSCYDSSLIPAMRSLISNAEIITPNLSEACLLLNQAYNQDLSLDSAWDYCRALQKLGAKNVLITSAIRPQPGWTATVGLDKLGNKIYHPTPYLPSDCPGAGDIFASVLLAKILKGKTLADSVVSAAEFVSRGIELALKDRTDPKCGIPLELLINTLE